MRSPRRVAQIVRSETLDVKKRSGDERRTSIEPAEDELSIEQITPNIDVGRHLYRRRLHQARHVGYVCSQNPGGHGMTGIPNLKREDVVSNFFITKTHDHVLFFTNKGRVYRLRGYQIPDTHAASSRNGVGQPADAAAW